MPLSNFTDMPVEKQIISPPSLVIRKKSKRDIKTLVGKEIGRDQVVTMALTPEDLKNDQVLKEVSFFAFVQGCVGCGQNG